MSTNEAALPQSTVRVAQADPDGILLVIHAGAGNRGKKDTPERRAVTQSKTYRSTTASFLTFHTFANRNLVFHDAPPLVVPVCVKRIVPRTKTRS